jgi:hypothetical protein
MADSPNVNARKVLTVSGILNWVFLAQPYQSKKYPNQAPRYKTQVMLNPLAPADAAEIEKVKLAQREVAAATWGDNWQQVLARMGAKDELVLHNGDLQQDDNAKGMVILNAAVKKPPATLVTLGGGALKAAIAANPNADWAKKALADNAQAANVPTAPGHPMYPYSGCRGAVMFELYVYNKESFVCQLMGVQFLEHGKPFAGGGGGRIARVDEFGINPTDADAAIPMSQADTGAGAGAASGLF